MTSLKYSGCSLAVAFIMGLGCSKREEVNQEETTKPRPVVSRAMLEPRPSERNQLTGKPATESPTGVPLPSTMVPEAPPTLGEITNMLNSTVEKQIALAAIRHYVTNNVNSLNEMSVLLKSPDSQVAALGAVGLAALGTRDAAAQLITAIQELAPGNTKRELTAALASFSNPEAAEMFIALAGSSQDRDVAAAIQRALGNCATGLVLTEVVQHFQSSNSSEERDNLVASIRHMQSPGCVDGLISILSDQKVVSTTEPLGLAIADTLGIIGSTNAVNYLFGRLDNLRPGDTSPIYDAIGRVSNPESLPLLAAVAYGQIAGSAPYSRMAAVQALGNFSSSQVAPVLNWLIQNDPNAGIKESARAALQNSAGR